ncbi:MAG: hypothetical protein H6827_09610 [Planctomycetes bacterium]|nr:hypothetical protein [Planctomycetota bacterium]
MTEDRKEAVFGITIVAVVTMFFLGLFGYFFWLGYTGKYRAGGPKEWIAEAESLRAENDRIMDTTSLGVVRKVDYINESEMSIPLVAGIGGGVGKLFIPIGGGSTTKTFTQIATDSATLFVQGAIQVRLNREVKVFKRKGEGTTTAIPAVDGGYIEVRAR